MTSSSFVAAAVARARIRGNFAAGRALLLLLLLLTSIGCRDRVVDAQQFGGGEIVDNNSGNNNGNDDRFKYGMYADDKCLVTTDGVDPGNPLSMRTSVCNDW